MALSENDSNSDALRAAIVNDPLDPYSDALANAIAACEFSSDAEEVTVAIPPDSIVAAPRQSHISDLVAQEQGAFSLGEIKSEIRLIAANLQQLPIDSMDGLANGMLQFDSVLAQATDAQRTTFEGTSTDTLELVEDQLVFGHNCARAVSTIRGASPHALTSET